MILLMKEFSQSGQTQREFSAAKGMGIQKFNYWFRKLKSEKDGCSGFVPVETGAARSGTGEQLELVYPNGVKVRFCSADLSLVSRLIRLY